MVVLGLRFCARAFSSCGERGPLFTLHRGVRAFSLSRPLSLRSTGSRRAGSVIVAHGPSRSATRGIFPDQGSNPCPLHWQADSQPLRHQGNPRDTLVLICLGSDGTYHPRIYLNFFPIDAFNFLIMRKDVLHMFVTCWVTVQ